MVWRGLRIVLGRLAGVAAAIVGVAVLVFLVFNVLPGQARPPGGPGLGGEFADFLDATFVHFRWGAYPGGDTLWDRLPATLWLMGGALALGVAAGVPLGVVAAARPRSIAAHLAGVVGALGFITPVYIVGLVAMLVFSRAFGVLPLPFVAGGEPTAYASPLRDPGAWATALALPWIALSLPIMGIAVRVTRGALRETLGEDWIRTARAKGVGERRIVWRHALRPAATAVVTVLGAQMATYISNAVIVETLFSLPGVFGPLRVGLARGVFGTILAAAIASALLVAGANLLADAVQAWLDPRVRPARGRGIE